MQRTRGSTEEFNEREKTMAESIEKVSIYQAMSKRSKLHFGRFGIITSIFGRIVKKFT
jgi:hypothetical protein